MPTAREIAAELRRVAEVLEQSGDVNLNKPALFFSHWDGKDLFHNAVKAMPRPMTKEYGKDDDPFAQVIVSHESKALTVKATIQRSYVCRIITPAQPAKFECESFLSEE